MMIAAVRQICFYRAALITFRRPILHQSPPFYPRRLRVRLISPILPT